MKESHRKGQASHPDPESCVGRCRKATIEALTGAHVGRVLSCEIRPIGVPTVLSDRKATSRAAIWRAARGLRAVEDPVHAWKLRARELGDPGDAHRWVGAGLGGEGHAP
jgi:hypothetical protein